MIISAAMKPGLAVIAVLVIFLASGANAATPEQSGFTAQPDLCIALHQGQVCYQHVTFTWNTPAMGEYCLYQLEQPVALTCWNDNQQSSYDIDFASSSSLTYQIRAQGQEAVLSQVVVEVSWVYRATRKSFTRWRLF